MASEGDRYSFSSPNETTNKQQQLGGASQAAQNLGAHVISKAEDLDVMTSTAQKTGAMTSIPQIVGVVTSDSRCASASFDLSMPLSGLSSSSCPSSSNYQHMSSYHSLEASVIGSGTAMASSESLEFECSEYPCNSKSAKSGELDYDNGEFKECDRCSVWDVAPADIDTGLHFEESDECRNEGIAFTHFEGDLHLSPTCSYPLAEDGGRYKSAIDVGDLQLSHHFLNAKSADAGMTLTNIPNKMTPDFLEASKSADSNENGKDMGANNPEENKDALFSASAEAYTIQDSCIIPFGIKPHGEKVSCDTLLHKNLKANIEIVNELDNTITKATQVEEGTACEFDRRKQHIGDINDLRLEDDLEHYIQYPTGMQALSHGSTSYEVHTNSFGSLAQERLNRTNIRSCVTADTLQSDVNKARLKPSSQLVDVPCSSGTTHFSLSDEFVNEVPFCRSSLSGNMNGSSQAEGISLSQYWDDWKQIFEDLEAAKHKQTVGSSSTSDPENLKQPQNKILHQHEGTSSTAASKNGNHPVLNTNYYGMSVRDDKQLEKASQSWLQRWQPTPKDFKHGSGSRHDDVGSSTYVTSTRRSQSKGKSCLESDNDTKLQRPSVKAIAIAGTTLEKLQVSQSMGLISAWSFNSMKLFKSKELAEGLVMI